MQTLRILAIDDSDAILKDYRKVLVPASESSGLKALEEDLFGSDGTRASSDAPRFELVTASQGQEGFEAFRTAFHSGEPFGLVLCDMRMPPGWDGLRTIQEIHRLDPDVPIVLCTAFSDYSVDEIRRQLGDTENFLILRKPFQPEEIHQLANMAHAKQAAKSAPEGLSSAELLRAMHAGQFELYFQPIVFTRDFSIKGFEALLRFHPRSGLAYTPDIVIKYAEESGAIHEIGDWVIDQGIASVKPLQEACELQTIQVSVNVSALQLEKPDFAERLFQKVEAAGVDPGHFAIEVTETRVSSRSELVHSQLTRLRQLGFEIMIDDFGTGYSTLHSLVTLPCDFLKLDGAFATALTREPLAQKVVQGTITMAKSLGLRTVAERVETREEFQLLQELGCDAIQGYLFAKAMPRDEAVSWCRRWAADRTQVA